MFATTLPAHAQRVRVWVDASASTTQPPAGVVADATAYGLLGLRAEVDAASALTLGARAHTGAGARTQDGRWVFGEAMAAWAQRAGATIVSVDASGQVLRYTDPYDYDAQVLRVIPGVRTGAGRVQLSMQGDLARGDWSSRYDDGAQGDSVLLRDGVTRISGGALSAASYIGAMDVEFGAALRDATNGTLDGRYATIHATAAAPLGPATVFATLRMQDAAGEQEAGGELGALLQAGSRTTLIALVTQPVTDPLYGTRSGFGVSIGASVKLHTTRETAGVAVVGASTAGRRAVTLRVHAPDEESVSVAGSFNGWTPVAMQQRGGAWTLTVHVEPGSYTFAFRKADGTWFVPDDAPGIVDDGFGQRNATLVVPPL